MEYDITKASITLTEVEIIGVFIGGHSLWVIRQLLLGYSI